MRVKVVEPNKLCDDFKESLNELIESKFSDDYYTVSTAEKSLRFVVDALKSADTVEHSITTYLPMMLPKKRDMAYLKDRMNEAAHNALIRCVTSFADKQLKNFAKTVNPQNSRIFQCFFF